MTASTAKRATPDSAPTSSLSSPFRSPGRRRAGESVVQIVEQKLLTPVGLRTLTPDDPRYYHRCEGSPAERDGAYQQGTVWRWLLGPYLTALMSGARRSGKGALAGNPEGLHALSLGRGIGTVAEIYDGDPPQLPRECFAQAWSVGSCCGWRAPRPCYS
jgi:glycogen debranching enzyme